MPLLGERDVLLVQGDLAHLPIKDKIVDVAQSIGVLHHTSDPFLCFSRICTALKKDGVFQIKVYNKLPLNAHYPFLLILRLISSMPHRRRIAFIRIIVAMLYPLQTVILKIFGEKYGHFRMLSRQAFFIFIHGLLSSRITKLYNEKEIIEWFSVEGLEVIGIGGCPISVLGRKYRVSDKIQRRSS